MSTRLPCCFRVFYNYPSWRTGDSPFVPQVPGYLKTLIEPCVDAKLLNMHLKGVIAANSGYAKFGWSGSTPKTLWVLIKTGIWLAFETVSNRQGSDVQGNPCWGSKADFNYLGIESALLLVIFPPKVMMSRLTFHRNNLKTCCLDWHTRSEVVQIWDATRRV